MSAPVLEPPTLLDPASPPPVVTVEAVTFEAPDPLEITITISGAGGPPVEFGFGFGYGVMTEHVAAHVGKATEAEILKRVAAIRAEAVEHAPVPRDLREWCGETLATPNRSGS